MVISIIFSVFIYILSFISLRYSFRLCSDRHLNFWENENCIVTYVHFIPILNTICAIIHWFTILYLIVLNSKLFNKILNKDLLNDEKNNK